MAFSVIFLVFLGLGVVRSVRACNPEPMIMHNEGHLQCMYLDIKGIKTIGVGYNMEKPNARADFHTIGADFDTFYNGPLTKSTAECNCSAVPCLKSAQVSQLLGLSLKVAIADAQRVISTFSSLCCDVQNTMVDMSFTLGGPGFSAFTTFAKLVNRQYWKAAGDDLTVSKWCNAKGQDVKRCHRDAAIVAKGCGCSGPYPQACPGGTSCCGTQETCCKATFTYSGFITKTFDEIACCPGSKATCCTHNRCCSNGGVCCPAEPDVVPTFCCPVDYPHCLPNMQCARGDEIVEGSPIHLHE